MTPLVNLRVEMKRLSLDALLITDEKNQQYLSGFAFSDGYLLVLENEAYLVTDFRYKEAAERNAYEGYSVVTPEGRISFMEQIVAEKGVRRLGFEGGVLTFAEHNGCRLRGASFCPNSLDDGN